MMLLLQVKVVKCFFFKKILGARCEENTFDGERCFHAALTDDIRKLLKEYKAVSRTHDPFSDFLRNAFHYHWSVNPLLLGCLNIHASTPTCF